MALRPPPRDRPGRQQGSGQVALASSIRDCANATPGAEVRRESERGTTFGPSADSAREWLPETSLTETPDLRVWF